MRKEYSDLPPEQKLVYIKRNIIVWICCFIPIAIVFSLLITTMTLYQEAIEDLPEADTTTTNSTNTDEPKNRDDIWLGFWLVFIMVLFFATLAGLTTLGLGFGEWVANKLNLYTDFELEVAERRVAEIKKALGKQETKSEIGSA